MDTKATAREIISEFVTGAVRINRQDSRITNYSLRLAKEYLEENPEPESASDAAKLAESQLRHAAEVARDNRQPNRAEYFEQLANRVFWEAPND